LALIEALRLHLAERSRLQEVQAAPALAAVEQPATAAAASSQAAVAGASGDGFIEIRSAPPPAPPVLAGIQQLNEEEHGEIRGVCDGCGQNVMSNDEGRWREGSQYYHEQCIKGLCGGCGLIVHANAERVRIAGVYWHSDCRAAPN
jgi:hypothetical protein